MTHLFTLFELHLFLFNNTSSQFLSFIFFSNISVFFPLSLHSHSTCLYLFVCCLIHSLYLWSLCISFFFSVKVFVGRLCEQPFVLPLYIFLKKNMFSCSFVFLILFVSVFSQFFCFFLFFLFFFSYFCHIFFI